MEIKRIETIKVLTGNYQLCPEDPVRRLEADYKEAIEALEKLTLSYIDLLKQDYGSSRTSKQIEKLFKKEIKIIEKVYNDTWENIKNES